MNHDNLINVHVATCLLQRGQSTQNGLVSPLDRASHGGEVTCFAEVLSGFFFPVGHGTRDYETDHLL